MPGQDERPPASEPATGGAAAGDAWATGGGLGGATIAGEGSPSDASIGSSRIKKADPEARAATADDHPGSTPAGSSGGSPGGAEAGSATGMAPGGGPGARQRGATPFERGASWSRPTDLAAEYREIDLLPTFPHGDTVEAMRGMAPMLRGYEQSLLAAVPTLVRAPAIQRWMAFGLTAGVVTVLGLASPQWQLLSKVPGVPGRLVVVALGLVGALVHLGAATSQIHNAGVRTLRRAGALLCLGGVLVSLWEPAWVVGASLAWAGLLSAGVTTRRFGAMDRPWVVGRASTWVAVPALARASLAALAITGAVAGASGWTLGAYSAAVALLAPGKDGRCGALPDAISALRARPVQLAVFTGDDANPGRLARCAVAELGLASVLGQRADNGSAGPVAVQLSGTPRGLRTVALDLDPGNVELMGTLARQEHGLREWGQQIRDLSQAPATLRGGTDLSAAFWRDLVTHAGGAICSVPFFAPEADLLPALCAPPSEDVGDGAVKGLGADCVGLVVACDNLRARSRREWVRDGLASLPYGRPRPYVGEGGEAWDPKGGVHGLFRSWVRQSKVQTAVFETTLAPPRQRVEDGDKVNGTSRLVKALVVTWVPSEQMQGRRRAPASQGNQLWLTAAGYGVTEFELFVREALAVAWGVKVLPFAKPAQKPLRFRLHIDNTEDAPEPGDLEVCVDRQASTANALTVQLDYLPGGTQGPPPVDPLRDCAGTAG